MIWVTADDVILIHSRIIQTTGGIEGLRDRAGLEAAIAAPLQSFGGEDLFPSDIEKIARIGFLEIAETVAKGRALADAGYGTQFCMNGEALTSIIADAPVKMPPDEEEDHPSSVAVSFAAAQPATPIPAPKQQVKPQAQPPAEPPKAPAPEPPKTVDEYLQVMTVDQAKTVKIDFGKFSGWTLGDIAMKSPGDLAWYVKNYSGHNLALKAGAIKLLEAAGQMAS